MVTPEQLKTCKACSNQKTNVDGEIICRFTNKYPDFKEKCILFEKVSGSEDESIFNEFETAKYSKSAGSGLRLANYFIDIIGFYIFVIIVSILIGIIFAMLDPSALTDIKNDDTKILTYLFAIVGGVIYFSLIEYVTGGRSLGKLITKTKVITLEGEKPSFQTYIVRSLCRFIPFEIFSFLGSEDAGWHDSISGTRVVKI